MGGSLGGSSLKGVGFGLKMAKNTKFDAENDRGLEDLKNVSSPVMNTECSGDEHRVLR